MARQPLLSDDFTAAPRAWLFRVVPLTSALKTCPFHAADFEAGLPGVCRLADCAKHVRQVLGALAELGVQLVVVEPLPRTRLDGAAFFTEDQPVIGLLVRYDRIYWFWHTLAHELVHVRHLRLRPERAWRNGALPPRTKRRPFAASHAPVPTRSLQPSKSTGEEGEGPRGSQALKSVGVQGQPHHKVRAKTPRSKANGINPGGEEPALQGTFTWG